jgi:hypothetical protein
MYKSGIIAALILLSIIFSCTQKQKGKSINKNSDTTHSDTSSSIRDTASYINIGNPDTALAIFLFENCFKYDYNNQFEEYSRWDIEKKDIKPIMKSLFINRDDYNKRIAQIDINRTKFINDSRETVINNYKTYSAISDGMEFDYLLAIKDSVLKNIIKKMLKDPKVPRKG